MLYDPKWQKPSVAGFRAWLGQRNPQEVFVYSDCRNCAVGQYMASLGESYHYGDSALVVELNAFAFRANYAARKRKRSVTFGDVIAVMDERAKMEI